MLWLVGCCGCSWVFVQPPPPNLTDERLAQGLECTESTAPPVWDVVFAVGSGVGMVSNIAMAATSARPDPKNTIYNLGIWTNLGLSILHTVSATWGFRRVRECNEAQARASRLRFPTQPPAPTMKKPPQPPPPPPTTGGCTTDMDCKGDRVCMSGGCVSPSPAPKPAPMGCVSDSECKGERRCVAGKCAGLESAPVAPQSAPPECLKCLSACAFMALACDEGDKEQCEGISKCKCDCWVAAGGCGRSVEDLNACADAGIEP